MYVIICNDLSIGKWYYLGECLLVIACIFLGGTVLAVIFWCIICAFGDKSEHKCIDLTVTDI